jgi:hypothetical protein
MTNVIVAVPIFRFCVLYPVLLWFHVIGMMRFLFRAIYFLVFSSTSHLIDCPALQPCGRGRCPLGYG